jgi:hypothetical protein
MLAPLLYTSIDRNLYRKALRDKVGVWSIKIGIYPYPACAGCSHKNSDKTRSLPPPILAIQSGPEYPPFG